MKTKLVHLFSAPQSVFYFMEHQLQYMKKRGIQVHVILPMDNIYYPKVLKRETGIFFHHVDLSRKISPIADLKSLFQILRVFWEVRPDIVHLHTPKASFLGALAAKLSRINHIIYHMHGLVSANNVTWANPIYLIEKATCRMAKFILCVSPSIMEYAITNKYSGANKLRVLENGTINGIDFERRFSLENTNISKYQFSNINTDKFVVGFLGRLCKEKGFLDYLEIMNDICRIKKTVVALIAGPVEVDQEIESILLDYPYLNKSNCLFIGEVDDPENVLIHFDLMLFPTYREGFGLVAAEANALSIPVVGYNIPGLRDAIADGSTGRLVSLHDTVKLKEAVIQYIDNQEILSAHGQQGMIRVRELFDGNKIRAAAYNFYLGILEQE